MSAAGMSYVGLDAGTTGIKALQFDENGCILASAYREYPLLTPCEGWCEIDALDVWHAAKAVLSEIAHKSSSPIQVIAVCSCGQAVVPLDRHGEPLYPFITTIDTRTVAQQEWWQAHADEEEIFRRTGLAFSPIYTANKIMWHRENNPALYQRTWKFLCVEDYLTYRLSGETVIDYSLAGRGMLFNARERRWDERILETARIDSSLLATPLASSTILGKILPSVAMDTGIDPSARIAVGGHDQSCGMLGCGAVHPGQAMDASGTVEVIMSVIPSFPEDTRLMEAHYPCAPHVAGDTYTVMSINQNAGVLLKWYKNTFCSSEALYAQQQGLDPYTFILEQSADTVADLYVLPHINGAETPVQDPRSAGAIVRLRSSHTKADVTRAVLDSLAYDMRQNVDAMEAASAPIHEIRAIGGGAKTPKLLQIKADALQKPIIAMRVREASALGAAILGAVGVGVFSSTKEAVAYMVRTGVTYEPNPSMKNTYNVGYAEYLSLYPALKPFNHRVSYRVAP